MNNETNQNILNEFTSFFNAQILDAKTKVEQSVNMAAVKLLAEKMNSLKSYTVEDVTPFGYGPDEF